MDNRRLAGSGLLVYGVGSIVTMLLASYPGGSYEPDKVTAYLAQGHAVSTFVIAYAGVASLLAVLAFGRGIRAELGALGDTASALTTAALAVGMTGWFLGSGVVVATAEGGPDITAGVPLPVAHTIGEIAGLLGGCGPALLVGVVALMLVRTSLPGWLRGFSLVAGICGILAPLYFTLFVFVLWTVVCGIYLVVSRASSAAPEPVIATHA